jgi:hypothetical protein
MNKVLSTLTGTKVDNPKSVIDQGFVGNSSATAGCLIKTNLVYSICNGTILAIGIDPFNNTLTITVEVSSQKWIRYCRLVADELPDVGKQIQVGDFLGVAYRGLMRLEYCTAEKSQFPVRELNYQLYKHDPTPIIFGGTV